MIDTADRRRPGHGGELHQIAEPHDESRRCHQRRIREVFGCGAAARAQHDRQAGLAIEILSEPRAFPDGAHHRTEGCTIPADLGDAAVIRLGMQLEGEVLGVRKALHGRSGKYLLEQRATFERYAVERGGVLALQMDAYRAGRATDAAEKIALDREYSRVGQAHGDFVAHQRLELADAVLLDDPSADRATAGPGEEVPVLQPRLRTAFHVGTHALEDYREQLAIDRLRAHAWREVEERIDGRALDGWQ